jgi:uncharacterized protein YggU (UPF0235/DUF167 family)
VDRIDGVVDGVLRVRVAAAPVDGAANAALVRLLASALGIPASAVTIASGATARRKVIDVDGVAIAALRSRWPGLDV